MRTWILGITILAALSAGARVEQDPLIGTWQGTLRAGKDLRLVVKVAKGDKGGYEVTFYSIDQGGQGFSSKESSLNGSSFKFSINGIGGSYEGKLSADGATIAGTWTQNSRPRPLTLARPSADTAWEIPKALKAMDPNVSPTFEVATLKPSDPDVPGHWIHARGGPLTAHNWSIDDFIELAYGVHERQIVGTLDWMRKDKFDVAGVADQEGEPNNYQLKIMIQKLLTDRLRLTLHHDKKELSVYTLSIGRNRPKLSKDENGGSRSNDGIGPTAGGIRLSMLNATMEDFADLMQEYVLDRPVVDQTGLAGRFDFQLTWAPDESQLAGRFHNPVGNGNSTAGDNPLPNLFTAVQEQLGLKLEATKAPCDVLVIDHVEKPSAN